MANSKPDSKMKTDQHSMVDIVADPRGDMVVLVGEKGNDLGKVRVHRSTMQISSPVFQAMLGGASFKESTRALDETDPLILDDDRTAFIVVCQILHHQSFDAAMAQTHLAQIAIIADKYGCAATVLQPIFAGLRPLVLESRRRSDSHVTPRKFSKEHQILLGNMIAAAYLSGDGLLLWEVSRYVIGHMGPEGVKDQPICDPALLKVVPAQLFRDLKAYRKRQITLLAKHVRTKVIRAIEDQHAKAYRCLAARQAVGTLVLNMSAAQSGSILLIYQNQAYWQTCLAIQTIADEMKSAIGDLQDRGYDEPECGCERSDFNALLANAIQGFSLRGLCLECFKTRGSFFGCTSGNLVCCVCLETHNADARVEGGKELDDGACHHEHGCLPVKVWEEGN